MKLLLKKNLLVGALIIALAVGIVGFFKNEAYADQPKTASDYSTMAGKYIKEHSDLLIKNINDLKDQNIDTNDVIAEVGSVKLSNNEFQFRKGLRQATGLGSTENNSIYNTLIEEKMLINYAKDYNLFPTKEEIDSFLTQEQNTYNSDANYKKLVDGICSASGFSLEQYWNTYEYYNAYRAVTFKNVYDYTISNAIKMNKVKALPSGPLRINSDIYKEQLNFYKQFKANLKSNIVIKLNDNYKKENFVVDRSKSYL